MKQLEFRLKLIGRDPRNIKDEIVIAKDTNEKYSLHSSNGKTIKDVADLYLVNDDPVLIIIKTGINNEDSEILINSELAIIEERNYPSYFRDMWAHSNGITSYAIDVNTEDGRVIHNSMGIIYNNRLIRLRRENQGKFHEAYKTSIGLVIVSKHKEKHSKGNTRNSFCFYDKHGDILYHAVAARSYAVGQDYIAFKETHGHKTTYRLYDLHDRQFKTDTTCEWKPEWGKILEETLFHTRKDAKGDDVMGIVRFSITQDGEVQWQDSKLLAKVGHVRPRIKLSRQYRLWE
jgi:hypothetical protein